MAETKLSTVLRNASRDCWLALSEDESAVVGRGETAVDAVEEAKRAGVEDPILVWAPKRWTPTIFGEQLR
jgi:cation diffusion facilitator CzcD-associated flavoprotein CzcO